MSKEQVLFEFKNQLVMFFDELIAQFPNEGDLVLARLFITTHIDIKSIMDVFILHLAKNNVRDMIETKNERFFLEYDFLNINQNKISYFKKLWRSGNLDDEDKVIIWRWVKTFVYLADKYVSLI